MLTGFFILNSKGDVLISKLFRDGVKRSIADVFRIQVMASNDVRSPILTLGSTTFLHIKSDNIWFVAVLRSNVDASIVFESLYKVLNIVSSKIPLTENDIKLNFTLIYEILDQVYEFGYPQTTEINTLQLATDPLTSATYAGSTTAGKLMARRATILRRKSSTSTQQTLGSNASNRDSATVPWRNGGLKYRKNQIYLDVHENVNLLISATGAKLRSYVDGRIVLRTQLTGMPVCTIGLNEINDSAESNFSLESFKFHQCVDLKAYEDKLIKFIPPDGEFELMTYRSNENINLPFKIRPIVAEFKQSSTLEIQVVVQSTYSKKLFAHNVELIIPLPNGTIRTNVEASTGKSKFDPELNAIVWRTNKFLGTTETHIKISAQINNSDNLLNWSRPPMLMRFAINMYSCSGLNIRFLRIENDSTKAIKWVKYLSKAGSYEIRY